VTVRFALLGGVEAHVDGRSADIGHARQRSVLAALLIDANAVVPTVQLVDRVWGDNPPQRATGTLHSYLTRLRRVDGVSIVRRAGGYSLVVEDPLTIDVHEFQDLVARARATDDPALYEQALSLWRGEALAGLDSDWAGQERGRLARERLAAELDHTDLRLRLGQHATLVPEVLTRAGEHPLDERVAGQLMLALYRAGRQAEALAEYDNLRRALATDLGLQPTPALQRLYQSILSGHKSLESSSSRRVAIATPAAADTVAHLSQLPRDIDDFTGRDEQVTRLAQTFLTEGDDQPRRLVAITGPPS